MVKMKVKVKMNMKVVVCTATKQCSGRVYWWAGLSFHANIVRGGPYFGCFVPVLLKQFFGIFRKLGH